VHWCALLVKFIIGIGNPGKEYEKTRHNVGFRVIDLLKEHKVSGACLVKPQTYVNRTGEEVLRLTKKHALLSKDILIVCDDVNLPFGELRFRGAGSSGGHKGLVSVIEALGSQEFARLRIGVGHKSMPKDLTPFVLGAFSAEEEKQLEGILNQAVEKCKDWIAG
jgi:PTH1 family peptidyl-tRNA hydrolase